MLVGTNMESVMVEVTKNLQKNTTIKKLFFSPITHIKIPSLERI